MPRKQQGMTLIELVIVVVVIAILASIAIPSYREYVLRSHRVEATAALLAIAAKQEKFYLACNSYTTQLTDPVDASDCADRGLGVPDADAGKAGLQTENGWYTVTVESDDPTLDFTLTATAIGSQARDTDCATFSVDHSGVRTATKDKCWD